MPLAPVMWLDDVLNGAEGLDKARRVNERMNILVKKKEDCTLTKINMSAFL